MYSLAELVELCGKLNVHDIHSVVHPAPRACPVECIVIHSGGFACAVAPTSCAFASLSEKWMKTHLREHPDRNPNTSLCYRTNVPLQTLYPHVGHKYFEVQPLLVDVPVDSALSLILRDFIPNLPPLPVVPVDTERERTPFMQQMNWDNHMDRIRGDPAMHTRLKGLLAPAAKGEPGLVDLHTITLAYMKSGADVGRFGTQSLTVRKHLRQGANISQG